MRGNPSLQRKWLEAVDAPPVGAHLVPRMGGWGAIIKVVNHPGVVKADALIIRHSRLFKLTMLAGDCPSVVLVDKNLSALGLIHASRGALERKVIQRALQRWEQVGASSEHTHAWVGPGIRSCCYRFADKNHLRRWPKRHTRSTSRYCSPWDKFYAVDLQGFIREQLLVGGLGHRITIASECTSCAIDSGGWVFPSHRRGVIIGNDEQRFLAVAWLK